MDTAPVVSLSPSNGQSKGQGTNFGSTLKKYREARKVSQSKLAERAGFDHSYVSRLESGARTPTKGCVLKLAKALGLSDKSKDLLLASAGFLPGEVLSLLDGEPEVKELLTLLSSGLLPEAHCQRLRQTVKALTAQAELNISTTRQLSKPVA